MQLRLLNFYCRKNALIINFDILVENWIYLVGTFGSSKIKILSA